MSERSDEPLRVGAMLRGYCGGYFGRDSYSDKRVEAVGFDWVVAREEYGQPVFAGPVSPEKLAQLSETADAT